MSFLFPRFTRREDEILQLNIGTVSPVLVCSGAGGPAFVPDHKFFVGNESGPYASLQITEQQSEDLMTATIEVRFPTMNGTWQARLRKGELRLFALSVDQVRLRQAKAARYTLVPSVLGFIVYFDDKQQNIFFAVEYCGKLGVRAIFTLPLSTAELARVIDSLQKGDPGELTDERVREMRERARQVKSQVNPDHTPPPL